MPRERLLGLPGRRVLEMMLAGELPPAPFAGIMRVELLEVGEGRVVFAGRPGAGFLNSLGTVHGGWTATLSTPPWAAPCIRRCRRAGSTPRPP